MNIVSRFVVLLTLWSAVGLSQTRPTVAPFPLAVKRVPTDFPAKQLPALEAEFVRALREANVQAPSSYKLEDALKRSNRQDCDVDDACLRALAVFSESLYGLYASVDYSLDGTLSLSGRVVTDEGKLIRPLTTVKTTKVASKDFAAETKKLMGQLLTQLQVANLPLSRSAPKLPDPPTPVDAGVVTPPPAPVDAGVPFTPPPPPPLEPSPLKTVGTVTAIAGAGMGAVGVALYAIGRGQAGTVLGPDGIAMSGLTREQANTVRSAAGLQTAGVTLAAVGVAAAGAGLVMMLLAPETPAATTMTVAPVPGGAAVVWTGVLP